MKVAFVSALLSGVSVAHMRLGYPEPRSTNPGATGERCAGSTGDWDATTTTLSPGEHTIQLTEVNAHARYTYRLSLSKVMDDTTESFDSCVLISHIPQMNNNGNAEMTLTIPDVDCNPCALRLEMIAGSDDGCCDRNAGECGTVYSSCANVIITGSKDRDDLMCEEPCDWKYRDWKDGIFSQVQDDGSNWVLNDNEISVLQFGGEWIAPLCDPEITEATPCPLYSDMTTEEPEKNSSSSTSDKETGERNGAYSYTTFGNGGKVEGDGALAIVVLLIVSVLIGVAWYKRRQNKSANENEAQLNAAAVPV